MIVFVLSVVVVAGIKKEKTLIGQFAAPLGVDTHNKPEVNIGIFFC